MTSKDFFYLGLMAVAALVAYCHGFFSGVSRARKAYEALLGSEPRDIDSTEVAELEAGDPGASLSRDWSSPHSRSRLSGQGLTGDFGNN